MVIHYDISETAGFINWPYFFHAWGLTGKPEAEKENLKAEALDMLDTWNGRYRTHAVLVVEEANSVGDDIIVDGNRIPFLRQQTPSVEGGPNLCLADFIRPLEKGIPDKLGIFATTVDSAAVSSCTDDCYCSMMAQTLADRLAEATAELLHMQVRREIWGYAPDESITVGDMLVGCYQGIRPAVGYPSIPDTGINFLIDSIVGMRQIGIRLTESGMMIPHASVSGFMFAHPESRYFDIGRIGTDQLADYARRRGLPVSTMKKFLES